MELLTPASANLEVALSFIEKDPMAGRLKDPETGNNSYHLLLGNDHSSEFVITVLKALIEKCPEGVRAVNNKGSLPLHMCLSQQDIVFEAAGMLLKTYPGAAGHANNQVLSNTSYPVRSNILFAYSSVFCFSLSTSYLFILSCLLSSHIFSSFFFLVPFFVIIICI